MPKSIVKKSKRFYFIFKYYYFKRNDEEDPKIIMKTNEKLLKKIGDFVEAVASGRPIVKSKIYIVNLLFRIVDEDYGN